MAAIYGVLGALYLVQPLAEPGLPLALSSLVTAALFVVGWYAIAKVPDRLVHAAITGTALASVAFGLAFVAFTGELSQSVILIMTLIGSGCILIHPPSMAVVIAAALVGWHLLAADVGGTERLHWFVNITVAGLLGLLVSWVRAHTLGRLEREKADAEEARERLAVQAAELAEARDAALASSRAKAEFLANLSHELRTPVGGIMGLSDLIADGLLDEDQRDNLDTLRSSAAALLAIIDDLLDFSRLDAGRLHVDTEPFDPRALVDGCVRLMSPKARDKRLRLRAVYDDSVAGEVTGEPQMTRRILLNLIDNAIKFTDRGAVEVEVALEGDRLLLMVRDTGVGIEPGDRDRIWAAFEQADGSTSRQWGGTGLGLAICRGLVELMHGEIALESEVGRGTTFRVVLPVDAASTAAVPAAS